MLYTKPLAAVASVETKTLSTVGNTRHSAYVARTAHRVLHRHNNVEACQRKEPFVSWCTNGAIICLSVMKACSAFQMGLGRTCAPTTAADSTLAMCEMRLAILAAILPK